MQTISEKQRQQQAELHNTLWKIANDLRGNMEANEFKNYILGLIFFRYLSEKVEVQVHKFLEQDNISYAKAWENADYKEALIDELRELLGYIIEPQHLFSSLVSAIRENKFDIELLSKAIGAITESALGTSSQDDFDGLFDDMDLTSSKLGKTVSERSKLIAKVILSINDLNFDHEDSEIDILGDAYEYLIGQFAASAGKKAGEFYTPQQVSKILARIVTHGKKDLHSVYDPCCGSGSLLLRVAKEANVRLFYGQEKISTTFNLARMNMLLHDVPYTNFSIANDDTLENPYFGDIKPFSAVVANPPYSANWSADNKFLDDERFANAGVLAPKSKADYAFVLHMLNYLDENGTMAVVLPHGVLFRGATEGKIREHLLKDKNYLDCVIGLPANIFFGTSIPTVILVFKKQRSNTDVLFIDASNDFEKGKNQNILREQDVDKIIEAYVSRKDIEKYSHLATMDEIKENDYNLNIPRYVDTFEEEEQIDIPTVMAEIKTIDNEIAEVDKELNVYLKELGLEEF